VGRGISHTVYVLRYARSYYGEPVGGIEFNEEDCPAYSDFAYFAFTIGMTFQGSDTNITTKSIRRLALRHAQVSYHSALSSSLPRSTCSPPFCSEAGRVRTTPAGQRGDDGARHPI
jgi:uncharacterized protein DUF1345